ncbi:rhodanese-like domain-containing protein [Microbacterium gorillae]|uniref:rhodanese-like domain-containing protein n=1 Tax=Microbacterium gorillae TaxID=1231063 RepID=UPI0005911580|nr:rhodanese-like domain-containing protein [Microbacterium gorillae]
MKSIDITELEGRGLPLIDVREVDEFAAGHVPGAVNIPMSEITGRMDELPAEPFDVICQAGGRSARVAEYLEAQGHDATNVDGGTGAWIAMGKPVEH